MFYDGFVRTAIKTQNVETILKFNEFYAMIFHDGLLKEPPWKAFWNQFRSATLVIHNLTLLDSLCSSFRSSVSLSHSRSSRRVRSLYPLVHQEISFPSFTKASSITKQVHQGDLTLLCPFSVSVRGTSQRNFGQESPPSSPREGLTSPFQPPWQPNCAGRST